MDGTEDIKGGGSACSKRPDNGDTFSPHSITLMCCVVLADYNVEHVPERQLYDAAS
jgi:hypothetical protein